MAWPHNPQAVYNATTNPRLRAHLRRGQWLLDQHGPVRQMGRDLISGIGAAGNALFSPAEKLGPRVLQGASRLGKTMANNPRLMGLGLTTAAVAPIMAQAFSNTQQRLEEEQMSGYNNPSRVITASLDAFLEKKAQFGQIAGDLMSEGDLGMHFGQPAGKGFFGQIGSNIGDKATSSFSEGVGRGVADAIVRAIFGAVGGASSGLKNMLITDPKRRAILDTVKRTDQIIADTLAHNPNGEKLIEEAYNTMVKIAPTLSTDINAVRSFLREAVIGGAGVNYATIKNLAEAERAVTGYHFDRS